MRQPTKMSYNDGEKYRDLVSENGTSIVDVPVSCLSNEICLAAVRQNGLAIRLIPDQFITDELYLESIKQDANAIELVPSIRLNQEMCDVAVNTDGKFMKYVPEEMQTFDLCMKAIEDDPFNIQYVKFPSFEMCKTAIEKNSRTLQFVNNPTPEIISLLDFYVGIEQFIPTRFKTPEIRTKLDMMYEREGYTTIFGRIRVHLECEKDSGEPCDHRVVMPNGELEIMDSRQIARFMHHVQMNHPHFDEILKNDTATRVTIGTIKIYLEKCRKSKPCRIFDGNNKKLEGRYFCHAIQRN